MEKYNKYDKVLNSIVDKKSQATKEEKQLLDELEKVVKEYKSNQMIGNIVEGNQKVNELLQAINEQLKYYIEIIPDKTSSKRLYIIDNLNGLKEDINNFKKDQYKMNYSEENTLINNCLESLTNSPFGPISLSSLASFHFPLYFDRLLVKPIINFKDNNFYSINERLTSQLEELLSVDNILNDLEQGYTIKTNKDNYEEIVNSCLDSLNHKDKILNNADLIVDYNKIEEERFSAYQKASSDIYIGVNERYNSVINQIKKIESNRLLKALNKRKLKELYSDKEILEKRKQEYTALEKYYLDLGIKEKDLKQQLKDKDIWELISISERFNRRKDRISLLSNLRFFHSIQDVENYYSRVEQEYNINKELLDNTNRQEEVFNNTASKEAKRIVEEDLKTAKELSKLKDSRVDPKLVIFIFKSLLAIKKTNALDIDKKSSDYLFLKEHYDNLINEKIHSYNKDYLNALEGKKYVKQKQC